jgi:tRNA A-37 threonylcarbamoyl transferase component Bud32
MELLEQLEATLGDRYRVERELGQGGMAGVFLAEDLKHKRRVAIKLLKPDLAALVGSERFLREIEIAATLQHPHILPLFDSGQVPSIPYYVMPYVEGESLRQRLEREQQLPIDAALQITREVGSALQYAHDHGVIHRDIKPENIMLSGGHAVVADFGIARAVQAVEAAIMRAMAKLPADRFGSIDDFLEALDRPDELATAAIPARPSSGLPCAARQPMAIALGVAVVAAAAWLLTRPKAPVTPNDGRVVTSVAVLPFQNLASGTDSSYLGDGMTDGLTVDLAQIGSLKVVSRASGALAQERARSLAQLGKDLGVDAAAGEPRAARLLRRSVRRRRETIAGHPRARLHRCDSEVGARTGRRAAGENRSGDRDSRAYQP